MGKTIRVIKQSDNGMSDEAIRQTRKCLFGCKCLDEDPRHPRCTPLDIGDHNALLVSSDDGLDCSYRKSWGNAKVCTCPAHYAHCGKPEQPRGRTLASEKRGKTDSGLQPNGHKALPATVEEAVKILIEEIPLKDKVAIANARAEAVGELTIDLVNHIRSAFGLKSNNKALLRSCSKSVCSEIEHPDDAAAVILARLVMALVKAHKLRAV